MLRRKRETKLLAQICFKGQAIVRKYRTKVELLSAWVREMSGDNYKYL